MEDGNKSTMNMLVHLRASNLPKVVPTHAPQEVFARVSRIDAEGTVRGTDETEVRDIYLAPKMTCVVRVGDRPPQPAPPQPV